MPMTYFLNAVFLEKNAHEIGQRIYVVDSDVLFIHAMLGCGTTSCLYDLGKGI